MPPTDGKPDCIQHILLDTWDNEGGAQLDSSDRQQDIGMRDNGGFLSKHIKAADDLIASGRYDEACLELKSAADRFANYRTQIEETFDRSIARLTTMGCRATPPDPRALELIRLKRQLTT